MKPYSAPVCWGLKFQDGDEECSPSNCQHRDSCMQATMSKMVGNSPTPLIALKPPPAPSFSFSSSSMVPIPPHQNQATKNYGYSPPTYQTTPTTSYTPSVNTNPPTAPSWHTNYSSSYSIPNPNAPDPLRAMHRPGTTGPSYYFVQYPHESASKRLIKNTILRALEAIFEELMMFFRHWTWPTRQK